jgi:hypothetical protein
MQKRILPALAACLLLLLHIGCGKHAPAISKDSSEQTLNAVQLFQDFESAPPELKTLVDKAWKSVQSGFFAEALKYLGQLEANPALSDVQKKSVADFIGRVKTQMAANAAAR